MANAKTANMKMQVSSRGQKRRSPAIEKFIISLNRLNKSTFWVAQNKPLGLKYFRLPELLQNVCI
jgi:hypothetical protein